MKSLLLFISFIFLFHLGYSQNDTIIYYKGNNKPALGKEDASRYISVKKKRENKFKISTFRKNEDKWTKHHSDMVASFENDSVIIIKSQGKDKFTCRVFEKVGSGFRIKDYDKKSNLLKQGLSRTLLVPHWEGQVTSYYKSGKLGTISRYKNNQEIENKNWLENGQPYFENVFDEVDVMPEFPGGEIKLKKFISDNLIYPKEAQNNNIQGRVFVSFVVDIDGKVIGAYIRESQHILLNQEALRVVSEIPNWRAGKLNGKPVRVGFTVPINFKLG